MPLGIMNSPVKLAVAKEAGQVTGTIIAANIQKMYNRMYGAYRQNAVWVYNQEIEPQLFKLSQPGTDNTGNAVTTWGTFMFVPPGAMSAGPYGTLMGRPMIPSQACSALSTEGDIIFAAWDQYLALLKSGPNPRVEVSCTFGSIRTSVALNSCCASAASPGCRRRSSRSTARTPIARSSRWRPAKEF
jgi:Phage capsid family.